MGDSALSWVLVVAAGTGVLVSGLSLTAGSADGPALLRGVLAFAAVALFGWAVVYVIDLVKAGTEDSQETKGHLVDVRLPSEEGGRSGKS